MHKVNALCMCVCVCARVCTGTSTEKVGILITVLQINVATNAFVVTISKIRWQYVIWCASSLVSASTVVLSAAVDRRS